MSHIAPVSKEMQIQQKKKS